MHRRIDVLTDNLPEVREAKTGSARNATGGADHARRHVGSFPVAPLVAAVA